MTELHERITARLDELQRIAKAADAVFPGPWRHDHRHKWMHDGDGNHIDSANAALGAFMAANAPDLVLRGLAEDRDILRRHRQEAYEDGDCNWCSTIGWPCPEILSLARRHGIQP